MVGECMPSFGVAHAPGRLSTVDQPCAELGFQRRQSGNCGEWALPAPKWYPHGKAGADTATPEPNPRSTLGPFPMWLLSERLGAILGSCV